MKTRQLRDASGKIYGFALENAYIQPRKIAALLKTVPDVSEVEVRRLFQRPSDIHVSFRYKDLRFIVEEPFGDNSEYLVGPETEADAIGVDVRDLEEVFMRYRLPRVVKLLGDLVSWKFSELFRSQ